MSYSVIEWRGNYYIVGEKGDPPPSQVGPFRYETGARQAIEQMNTRLQEKERVNN